MYSYRGFAGAGMLVSDPKMLRQFSVKVVKLGRRPSVNVMRMEILSKRLQRDSYVSANSIIVIVILIIEKNIFLR